MGKRKRTSIGEKTADKLAGRAELRAENMPHGEVFRGGLADRALNAVGAGAMTIDGEIVVNNQFSSNRPEDQALYAHEMYHQEHSGGEAGDVIRDAEEISARAVESMVFHRAKNNVPDAVPKSATELLRSAKPTNNSTSDTEADSSPVDDLPSSAAGYQALVEKGFSREEIVHMLALKIVDEIENKHVDQLDRAGAFRSFIR